MNGEYAVIKILLNDPSVSSLVLDRVYLDEAPQTDPLPYIIVEQNDVEPFRSKSGVSSVDHDMIRVYPYAETQAQLKSIAQACRNALDGFTGTQNGIEIEHIRFESQTGFTDLIENRKFCAKDQEYTVRVKL